MMIDIGREYGLRAIRVPAEHASSLSEWSLRQWSGVLRRQAASANLFTNDRVLGLADTGHMTPARTKALLHDLPSGVTEMYFHPATHRDTVLQRLMPDYEHEAELDALLKTLLPDDVTLCRYGDLTGTAESG